MLSSSVAVAEYQALVVILCVFLFLPSLLQSFSPRILKFSNNRLCCEAFFPCTLWGIQWIFFFFNLYPFLQLGNFLYFFPHIFSSLLDIVSSCGLIISFLLFSYYCPITLSFFTFWKISLALKLVWNSFYFNCHIFYF